jgi:hypothetical protein
MTAEQQAQYNALEAEINAKCISRDMAGAYDALQRRRDLEAKAASERKLDLDWECRD